MRGGREGLGEGKGGAGRREGRWEGGGGGRFKRRMVIPCLPPPRFPAGGVSVEDVLPQMLSIQSNLQSILEQLASLVSSISSLPQLRPPQPHPRQQVNLALLESGTEGSTLH